MTHEDFIKNIAHETQGVSSDDLTEILNFAGDVAALSIYAARQAVLVKVAALHVDPSDIYAARELTSTDMQDVMDIVSSEYDTVL